MRLHWKLALGWLVFLAISSAANLVLPVAVKHMINNGFAQADPGVVNRTFSALFAVALAIALSTALRFFCINLLSERSLASLRSSLYDHLIKLDVAFFEETRVGELLSRLGTDTELVQTLIGSGISVGLRSVVMIIGAMIAMILTSPALAGLTALVIPAVLVPILTFGRRVQRLSRDSQRRLADAAVIANETLNAAPLVKSFSCENSESRRYTSAIHYALSSASERIGMTAALSASVTILVFGAIILVLWAGAREVLAGELNPGLLGQFVLYALFAAGAVGSISGLWGDVMRASGAMERIADIFDEIPSIRSPAVPLPLATNVCGQLRFEDVSFSYPARPETMALKNFELTVEPGETVALVGPSGAGKSTVFHLLLRLYDPQQGCITLDGIDLRELALEDLRGVLALVPQGTALFSGTAAHNIRFGREDADDKAMRAAAGAAEADAFLSALPQGYNTELGEHSMRLSGGESQRVAIARAILRDAPLLLLDEATSSLDVQSEASIHRALERLKKGRTTLVIAHRLATVQRADRIVVLQEGRIVAQGTHDSLLREGGLYTDLARLQFIA